MHAEKKGKSKLISVADWFSKAQLLPFSGRQDETSQEKICWRGQCPVPPKRRNPIVIWHVITCFQCVIYCPQSCSCVTTACPPALNWFPTGWGPHLVTIYYLFWQDHSLHLALTFYGPCVTVKAPFFSLPAPPAPSPLFLLYLSNVGCSEFCNSHIGWILRFSAKIFLIN